MTIFLRRLLKDAPWTLAAISGDNKEVRTFRTDPESRERALEWIAEHPGWTIRALAGRTKSDQHAHIPTLDHVRDVFAIGIRVPPSQAKALRSLQNPPTITFKYDGKFIAGWVLDKPASPKDAEKAEKFIAEKFHGERLNFFFPVPRDNAVEDFTANTYSLKEIEALSPAEDDDEELSAELVPEQRKFAVEPIAQRGKIALIAGDAGMGKSTIALDLAKCVTQGTGLPGQPAPQIGCVMVAEEEDDWKEDVVPRLIANGANRKFVKGIRAADLHTERGIAKLDAAKMRLEAETGLPLVMLILSPYMACFGGGSNQEVHMREKLRYIQRWAKQTNVAVLGVAHLGEDGGVSGPKTHRRLARGSWKVVVNENDPEQNPKKKQRLLVADKVNNAPDDFSLAYRIQGVMLPGGIRTSKIIWDDQTFIADTDTPIADAPQSVRDRAALDLQTLLRDGPLPSNIALEKMRGLGYSSNSIYAAKDALRIPNGTKGKTSTWALP